MWTRCILWKRVQIKSLRGLAGFGYFVVISCIKVWVGYKVIMTEGWHAWKEHDHQIIAMTFGYQALLTTCYKIKENQSPNAFPTKTKPNAIVNMIEMHFCWSHGLGFNSGHTSCTGKNKKDGHKDDTTIRNHKGGKNSIWECNSYHKWDGQEPLDVVKCKDTNPNIIQHTNGPPFVSYYSMIWVGGPRTQYLRENKFEPFAHLSTNG